MSNLNVDLSGKVAAVTGGGSGIGLATSLLLADAGATVFACDLKRRPKSDELFQERGIEFADLDVRDVSRLQQWIDGIATQAGRLDVLINNAGIVFVKQCPLVTEEEWDRCLDTNLKAAFFASGRAIPHMIESGGGCIVNTASNAGLLPRAHDPVYSISKMALVGLTKSLALSHSKDRIRVNCVCPGPVEGTEIMDHDLARQADPDAAAQQYIAASPLARAYARMVSPEEVAQAVLYLVSDAAMMVTGTAIAIDGGKSLGVPPRADESP